jgi:hypothetical protein
MLGDSDSIGKQNLVRIFMQGYFITAIGLICFLEGLPYLATPEQVKKWLQWLLSAKIHHMRLLGGALMVAGLLLVYWGRTHGG